MQNKYKKIILNFLMIIVFTVPLYSFRLPMYPIENTSEWVFSITNNLGSSQVVYGADMNVYGEFISSTPVYNYWYRPSGNNPRKVTYFENEKMYGIQSQVILNATTSEITLKVYPQMPVIIRSNGRKVMAFVNFEGKEYQLKYVSVHAEKAMIGIKIKSVQLVLTSQGWETRRTIY